MREDLAVLARCPLFADMDGHEITEALETLGGGVRRYGRRAVILAAGDRPEHLGVVLAGGVQVTRDEPEGGRGILAELGPGELFAEALVGAGVAESPVTVTAVRDSRILSLPYGRLVDPERGGANVRLTKNFLTVLARKNLYLTEKIALITKGNIRRRLMAYFYDLGNGRAELDLPFNREELADYLACNRSALSRELGNMQREGIITIARRHVVVHRWN